MAADLMPNEVFSEEYAHYRLDVKNFDFQKIDERAKRFDRVGIKKFLDSCGANIDVDEFIAIYNLQSYIYMVWPERAKNRPYREYAFKIGKFNRENPMPLSVAFDKKIAACVECSLLAQMYLQHCGIESVLCCGSVFFEQNPKIKLGGAAHAYLVIRLNGKQYIYDPANPMLSSNGVPSVPTIMSYDKVSLQGRKDFNKLLSMSVADGGGFAYIETHDIYGAGRCWLYGFESDDEINRIHRRRTDAGIKRQRSDGSQQMYQNNSRQF